MWLVATKMDSTNPTTFCCNKLTSGMLWGNEKTDLILLPFPHFWVVWGKGQDSVTPFPFLSN